MAPINRVVATISKLSHRDGLFTELLTALIARRTQEEGDDTFFVVTENDLMRANHDYTLVCTAEEMEGVGACVLSVRRKK